MESNKDHWEKIYSKKRPDEISWTQEIPKTSLEFIHFAKLSKEAAIIDIGGGDSRLVDFLLDEGYVNLTVLDISEQALARAKMRLGDKASKINWIVCDIIDFVPTKSYDLWHDRAAFHFLTNKTQIEKYISIARAAVMDNGYLAIGTFSEEGPDKCSGLEVAKYSEDSLTKKFENGFEKLNCKTEDHITPFDTMQNFIFCLFIRRINLNNIE